MNFFFQKVNYYYFYLKSIPFTIYLILTGNFYRRKWIANKKVMTYSETNNYLSEKILSGEPFIAGRYGSTEYSIMYQYSKKQIHIIDDYSEYCSNAICKYSGFFPKDISLIDKFAKTMLDITKEIDLLANWNIKEPYILNKYTNKKIKFCFLEDLNPLYGEKNPWTLSLKGKKVLVIHPFVETIQKQYQIKDKIFPNGLLPDFELKTIKSVQTIAGENDMRYSSWFEALDYMKQQMKSTDFDIAIIGCGAYGLPLAVYAKEIGKQAIHMGGATQLLFGIIGKRWEAPVYSYVQKYINEYWVRPSENERPKLSGEIENGCYW